MMPFILHVAAITTVCFLFYKLLLQRETFYRLNRWTLIGCLAVSFTLPLVPVPRDWSWRVSWATKAAAPVVPVATVAPPVVSKPGPVQELPDLRAKGSDVEMDAVEPVYPVGSVSRPMAAAESTAEPVKKVEWLLYLYGFGLILFGGNFLLQIAVLLYQSYRRPVIRDGRFRIVEVGANRAPCSFGNTIFINPALYDWETYNQILIHEKVHISGRHTLDILLAEMAVVLQWFNPFAWLYRREVENNLEFLTDASVLEHREVERSAYQLSLLRVSAPNLPFSITNNYNQSLLKRRIVMMNSKRSSIHTVWKYFFLIPLLTGLVCALNNPAALGADRKNSGPLAGTHRPAGVESPDLSLVAVAENPDGSLPGTAADTSRKPRKDSAWSAHEKPVGAGRPVLSMDSLNTDGEDGSARIKMYLDQALQSERTNGDALVDVKGKANEQMAMAKLAQLDMLNRVEAEQQAKVSVDKLAIASEMAINIGDIHEPGDSEMIEGAWFATSFSTDDRIQFELKREIENGNWSNSFSVGKSEFNPYPGQGNVEFKLVRDAGTVNFKGQFDGQEGFGHFRYTANEAYFNDMKQMGLEVDGRRFAFFTMNIKKDYVAMLQRYFPHLTVHDVFASAGNHLDADAIKYWQGTGLVAMDDPRTIITLQRMHIDRAYVDELKAAGYDHLEPRELISLKSQHIDGAYIRSLGRGKDNEPIPVRDLVSLKVQHIDSGYIASLRKLGYGDLERKQLVSLYNQHITADFIKGFQDIGYKDLSARDLISLKLSGITPEYVKGYIDIGYNRVDLRQLRAFKSLDITPGYVKAWRDLGYEDIDANRLASLKSTGITPDFVRAFNKIGFEHIPINMLGLLKSTGVNAEYVSKMKEKGFVSKDLGKYIRLKNDFN